VPAPAPQHVSPPPPAHTPAPAHTPPPSGGGRGRK
jgi:hypothetical protein